jgi:hypothetical protein
MSDRHIIEFIRNSFPLSFLIYSVVTSVLHQLELRAAQRQLHERGLYYAAKW